LSILALESCRYLNNVVLKSYKSTPTSLEITLGRFGSFSGGVTRLVTREAAEPTGIGGLASLEELTWLTRVVGLDDLATTERELARPTWSIDLVV
jgi:hypothetical protein